MNSRISACLVVLFVLAGSASPIKGIDLRKVLTGYTITSWSLRDGLPFGAIYAIAQDADGYLWVGMNDGLFRFDGVRFMAWGDLSHSMLQGTRVRSLCLAADGSLWVGFEDPGGISRISQGRVWNYGEESGLSRGTVRALVEDSAGQLWAGNDIGLFRLEGERWARPSPTRGLVDEPVHSVYTDRRGHLLVGTETGLFRRSDMRGDFERAYVFDEGPVVPAARDISTPPRSISDGPLDGIYVTDRLTGFRVIGDRRGSQSGETGRGYRLLYDRRANLWVGTLGQGLWRVRTKPSAEALDIEVATSLTGLLNDEVISLHEDTEGNIWAGSRAGLSRLTPHKFSQVTTNSKLVIGLEATPDGNVWVGGVDELSRFSPERPETPLARTQLRGSPLRAMHADERGTLWLATTGAGVARLTHRMSAPERVSGTETLRDVGFLTSDFEGGLWLYDLERGLLRWSGGRLKPFAAAERLPAAPVSVLYTDRSGRLWVAFAGGEVGIIERSGALRLFGAHDGLRGGTCRQIYEDESGVVWLACVEGLSRFSRGRFDTLHFVDRLPVDNPAALIDDDADHLWIGSSSGILRIAKAVYDKALANRLPQMEHGLFRRIDGIVGVPITYNNARHAIRDRRGTLWFTTSAGVTLIDPRTLTDQRPEIPVRIDQVIADGKRVPGRPPPVLPSGTLTLEINYTALHLTSPLRVRFRYQLEGFDAGWIDAGTRRQAFYTNLPPGRYRFRVVTGHDDGTWADVGATWEFAIDPKFYQTFWFKVSMIASLGAAVWGLWHMRLRQVRQRFSSVLGERARVSRELHDTLVQSLMGMSLQLDAIGADASSSSPGIQEQLVRMRSQVDEYLREARQSILELRSPLLERRDLVALLREMGEQLVVGHSIDFELSVSGPPRKCGRDVEEQLLRIGKEAITNAIRHARARTVRMNVHYERALVVLTVSDDGCGFDLADLDSRRNDRYGLIGMKERAVGVDGELRVTSSVDRGTEVRVTVPIVSESRWHA